MDVTIAATARISIACFSDEVIPLYYQRDRDGLPRGWIKRMKRTIRTLGWRFNADRMVMDYTLKCYVPAAGGTSSEIRLAVVMLETATSEDVIQAESAWDFGLVLLGFESGQSNLFRWRRRAPILPPSLLLSTSSHRVIGIAGVLLHHAIRC